MFTAFVGLVTIICDWGCGAMQTQIRHQRFVEARYEVFQRGVVEESGFGMLSSLEEEC
jgi:hypothetical protein